MSSYKLNFKKFSGGEIIRTYSNNELYGYVIIESDEPIYDSVLTDLHLNFINADKSKLPKREAILRAKTELLKKFVEEFNGKELLGRVYVFECLEDEIPYEIQKQFLRDDIPLEQAISPFIKTFKYNTNLGHNKNEEQFILKNNNKRILQFMNYSPVIKGDIIISEYDIDVLQNIVDVFSEYIKEDEEVEIKKYDSLLIRLIKQKKITQIAESKNRVRNFISKENKIVYLKIASFFWKDSKFLNFFVEYKIGENPFGTFLPISYKGVFGFHNRPPIKFKPLHNTQISQVFKDFSHNHITEEITFNISASMCFYYCEKTGHEFNLDIFKEFYSLENFNYTCSKKTLSLPTYLDPNYDSLSHNENTYALTSNIVGEQELDWSRIHDFYTNEDYANYLVFAERFEEIVTSNSCIKSLFSDFNEIIFAELVLKNIARPYFVGIEEYPSNDFIRIFNNQNQVRYVNIKSDYKSEIINRISLMDTYFMSPFENIPNKHIMFSLSTHIDYVDDKRGNYSIKYNLPVSQNDVLGSNFSLNFSNEDIIEVNLAKVMRYSQNYIDFQKLGDKGSFLDFSAIREFFTPIVPVNYQVQYENFEKLYKTDYKKAEYFSSGRSNFDSEIKFRYSYLYQLIKGKKILSKRFIDYCMYLHRYSFEGLSLEDINLSIPFWEIPRMQLIVLENFLHKFYSEIEYEQLKFEEEFENDDYDAAKDGLDDFYNEDPDWYWNIE